MLAFPFDSTTGTYDRAIDSDTYAKMLNYMYNNGVFPQDTDGCKVTASGTGLGVNVNIGNAMVGGRFKQIDEVTALTLDASDTVNPRIDRIILRMNKNVSVRDIVPMVLTGIAESTPTVPALTRSDTVYDISLCQILVPANKTLLLNSDITDERNDLTVCGFVNVPLDGTLPIERGGTGATTQSGVLTNLGLTATRTELNYVHGTTSRIQTQLNNRPTAISGTWTPTLKSWDGTSTVSITPYYTQWYNIGRITFVQCQLKINTKPSTSYNIALNGLPFVSDGVATASYELNSSAELTGTTLKSGVATMAHGKNYITFCNISSNDLAQNSRLAISLVYFHN